MNTVCFRYEDEPPEPEIEVHAYPSVHCSCLSCVFVEGRILIDLFNEQEGAEEELENNNEDAPDDVVGAEAEDKEQEKKARDRKTTKYMTKYERARILGTRALQIRYVSISVCNNTIV